MSHTGRAPGGFPGDTLNHPYMASVGLQSPIMHQRNFLHMTSPPMASPQFIPPGLLLSAQFSPEMLQLSASRQMHGPGNRMGRLIDTNVIPAPQVHRQMDHSSMNQMGTVQQQMMMNPGMVNNSGMRNNAGMGNEFMDNQAARMGGAMMNQSAAINHQALLSEEQMLQNKLAAIYANNNNQFDSRPMSGPQSDNEMPARDNSPGLHEHFQQNQKVEIPPGQNPRRMPPPSLLKRDDSLKMEKVFSATSPGAESVKKKVDGNASNLSAMSLSLGDMNYEGNLSSVFDNSLRISGVSVKSAKEPTGVTRKSKQERTSNASDNCDMSVATLGISEHGNMSYATFGDPKLQESEGNMSFSRVFEDPDKLP